MSRSNVRNQGALPVGVFIKDTEDVARSLKLLPDLYAAVYAAPDRAVQRGETRLTLAKLNELTQRLASSVERFASNYSSAVTPARDATFIKKYMKTHGDVKIPEREVKVSAAHNPAYYTDAVFLFAQQALNQGPNPDVKESAANHAALQNLVDSLGDTVTSSERKNLFLLSRSIVSSLVRLSIGSKGLKHTADLKELVDQKIIAEGRDEASLLALQRSTVFVDEDLKRLVDIAVQQRSLINDILPPEEKKGRQERKTPQRDLARIKVGDLLTWTDLTTLYSMLDVTTGILTLAGNVVDGVFVPTGAFSNDFKRYAEEKKFPLPTGPSELNDADLRRVVRLANNYRAQAMRNHRLGPETTRLSISVQSASKPSRSTARGTPAEQEGEEQEE